MRFFFKCSLYFSKTYWKYNWKNVVRKFFQTYGFFWLILEPLSCFAPQTTDLSRGNWILFSLYVVAALLCAIGRCSPTSLVSCRLNGRDVSIEIRVDDIFNMEGAFVISTNTTFDTEISNDLISEDSLQGRFTLKYYRKKMEYLDHVLEEQLKNQKFTLMEDNRKGKKKRYDPGTVVKLHLENQVTYLVAVADMNEHGVATGSFEKIIECLGKLWHYIGEQGALGHLVVPVLGTGRARINVPREDMIREIIKSFITACSEKKFSEKLTIVISEGDYREYKIDLEELGNYLRHHCKYTVLKNKADTGEGEAIP